MTARSLRSGKSVQYTDPSTEDDSEDEKGPAYHGRSGRRERLISARKAAELFDDENEEDEDEDEGPAFSPRKTRGSTAAATSSAHERATVQDNSEEFVELDERKLRQSLRVAGKPRLSRRTKTDDEVESGTRDSQDRDSQNSDRSQPRARKRKHHGKSTTRQIKKKIKAKPKKKHVMGKQRLQAAGYGTDSDVSKKKRLEFLLKQSEEFAHLIATGNANKKQKKTRRKTVQVSQPDSSQGTDHRHARRGSSDDDEAEETLTDTIRFEKTPFYIAGGEMRDYQIRGLNWLISLYENSINGILADEMGLGKTLQTIAVLGYMYNVKKRDEPHLVIAPKSTLSNWKNEFSRWCPSLDSAILLGTKEERAEFINESKKNRQWDVLITSYEIAIKEQGFIRRHRWGYLVVDEAHRIKNEASLLASVVRTFSSLHRLLLTGTPLQNNLHELWALLNFLLPDIFQSADDFDNWFGNEEGKTDGKSDDINLVERLHSILRPFLLRRVKAEVEKNLPPKTEVKLFVGLTEMQRLWYKQVLLRDITLLNSKQQANRTALHNVLMHLRKVCDHPYLFEGAEPGPPYTTEQHLVDNSGKMVVLHKLLIRLKEKGSRVLIFSQMTRLLDILEDYCGWAKYEYCRLDGSTAHEDREISIKEFNTPSSSKFIFLLSTRAGGLGINLVSADTVILFDSDWNPQVDLQAMDRVHRIGQTRPVTVFRLITEGTVEEYIIERAEKKLRLDALVIQSGRLVDPETNRLGKDDLFNMIRHGAQKIISNAELENIQNEDIDVLIEKSKAKAEELAKKYGELTEENLRGFVNDTADKDYYNFGGEDFRKMQTSRTAKLDEIEQGWIALPKRERKNLHDPSTLFSNAGTSRESPPTFGDRKKPKPPVVRAPYQHKFLDIHFAPPRLNELLDRELFAYRRVAGWTVDDDPEASREEKEKLKIEKAKLVTAQPLTTEEEDEKRRLLGEVFSGWTRTDFQKLLKGLDNHSINEVEKIAAFVERKPVEEVRRYLAVFAERYKTLPDSAKIYMRIQRGMERQDRQKRRREAIKIKLAGLNFPQLDLKVPYPPGHNKAQQVGLCVGGNTVRMTWSEEADRHLLCMYAEACKEFRDDSDEMFGFIRDKIHTSREFLFNNMMRSLPMEKVKERLETLLGWVVKDVYPMGIKILTENRSGSSTIPSTSATFVKPKNTASKYMVPAASSPTVVVQNSTQQSFPKSFTLQCADGSVGSGKGQFVLKGPSMIVPYENKSGAKMAAETSGTEFTMKDISVTKDGDSEVRTFVMLPQVQVPHPETIKLSGILASSSKKPSVKRNPGSVERASAKDLPTGRSKLKSPGSTKKSVNDGKTKVPEWAKPGTSTGVHLSSSKVSKLKLKRKAGSDGSDADEGIVLLEVSPPKKLAGDERV
ncbi:hypothetical protein RvY_09726 [Ramazzottius varieornatus]|uniref:Uncharacterized protein n=1 Tax=Ramazzottius varieornatus TaxID=947166 RepID=A0A1D1VCI1_RAMVA|nr:hypothetical protein RvY_09726 [Ramazzottius varieornatus]